MLFLHALWKLQNFTATVFLQIFRQINVLLKNFTVNQFDEKKLRGREFLVFLCVHNTNFVKIMSQTKEVTQHLISRNIHEIDL